MFFFPITYVTKEPNKVERAFRQGYGLDSLGWRTPSDDEFAKLNPFLGFPEGSRWDVCGFYKKGVGQNIQVRVISCEDQIPLARPEYDGLYVGGATISFPKPDLHDHERLMADIGIKSTMGVKEMEFESPSGETYTSAEIIYFAPENVYLLAVKRPEIFAPVGPTDPDTGIGGAAYSARCVGDASAVNAFLQNVLGYEIRRDVVFTVGEQSALLLKEGVEERFVQAFAAGSSTGYLVLMDHMDDNKIGPAPTDGPQIEGFQCGHLKRPISISYTNEH